MKLRDKLLSDENIYCAILSLPHTIQEPALLNKQEIEDLHQLLTNPYVVNQYIKKCRKILVEALDNPLFIFKLKIFFKFKNIEENHRSAYRFIHSCDILTHIALSALMQTICFDDNYEDNTRNLSALALAIPEYFFGNKLNTDSQYIYHRWMDQYRSYMSESIAKAAEYRQNKQYKQEAYLDIRNFFSNVNPAIVYQWVLSHVYNEYINAEDWNTYQRILQLLLFYQIDGTYSDYELKLYYGESSVPQEVIKPCIGLPPGVAPSYFFANIVMIEIADCVQKIFPGDALYYVDDSVLFTNCDESLFANKVKELNAFLDFSGYNNPPSGQFPVPDFLQNLHNNLHYHIQFHGIEKSSIVTIEKDLHQQFLIQFLNSTSGLAKQVYHPLDKTNTHNAYHEINIILQTIENELNNKISQENPRYIKRLNSNKRHLQTWQTYLLENIKDISPDQPQLLKEKLPATDIDEQYFKKLFTEYKIRYNHQGDSQSKIRNSKIKTLDLQLADHKIQSRHLYYIKASGAIEYLQFRIKNNTASYYTLLEIKQRIRYAAETSEADSITSFIEHIYDKPFLKDRYRTFAWATSPDFQRWWLYIHLCCLLDIPVIDDINHITTISHPISWNNLRILFYLQQHKFKYEQFKEFMSSVIDNNGHGWGTQMADTNIYPLLPIFARCIDSHDNNDDLICTHQFVFDLWKNGSKYLHFFTLHNVDHSIVLIKSAINFIGTCRYFELSSDEYYHLFLACYLHDIAMVSYPNELTDKLGETGFKAINKDLLESYSEDISKWLVAMYKAIDGYFEGEIRRTHPEKSAEYIKNLSALDFLTELTRQVVAQISENHGKDTNKIYIPDSPNHRESILLRVADLVDIGEERVSYNYLNFINAVIPKFSKFHWLSHLAVKSSHFKVVYTEYDKKIPSHRIAKADITLEIQFNAISNESILNTMPCENASVSIKDQHINIRIGDSICKQKSCPLICKWNVKKNGYLIPELKSLTDFLKRAGWAYDTTFHICLIPGTHNEHFINEDNNIDFIKNLLII